MFTYIYLKNTKTSVIINFQCYDIQSEIDYKI